MFTSPTGHIPGLMSLISAAVAPVVLISAIAILFSALTAKHSHLADQVRQIASEFRDCPNDSRRLNLGRQLRIFERRMSALWLSTEMLSVSLLFFAATILFVIATQRTERMGVFGEGSLVLGLVSVVVGILAELYEISLARDSFNAEVVDCDDQYRTILKNASRSD
jgi:hypothetical protein